MFVVPEYILDKFIKDENMNAHIKKSCPLKAEHYSDYDGINVNELAALHGLKVYDTALPQSWYTKFTEFTKCNPVGHIVWCYDVAKVFGAPVGITSTGQILLEVYKHHNQ